MEKRLDGAYSKNAVKKIEDEKVLEKVRIETLTQGLLS